MGYRASSSEVLLLPYLACARQSPYPPAVAAAAMAAAAAAEAAAGGNEPQEFLQENSQGLPTKRGITRSDTGVIAAGDGNNSGSR